MICPCGGQTREHEVHTGRVVTCVACGRRELFPFRRALAVPAAAAVPQPVIEPESQQDLFA